MYRVINKFRDLKDKNFIYEVGAEYPRKGYLASKERIEELSSPNNKTGKVLIEEVKAEPKEEPQEEPKNEDVDKTTTTEEKSLKTTENEEEKPKKRRRRKKGE